MPISINVVNFNLDSIYFYLLLILEKDKELVEPRLKLICIDRNEHQSIYSVRKDAAGLILISCLVPAEPRALRRDHRQERPASLGREPEPGMLGHEKSADRPALIISFACD